MSLGVILLVHMPLARAAEVARHWAAAGCPLVIHVDGAVPDAAQRAFRAGLADLPDIAWAPRRRCDWGGWSLVAATQDAAALMLARFPDIRHVYLASGSCLPIRPVAELRAHLDAHPRTDFIESVTTRDVDWIKGGLAAERFAFTFPFSWRRHRRLFDAWTRLQRAVGRRRTLPQGIEPHLGSQWWCLTRRTLSGILADPDRRRFERFFRRVWIPDESYFQTLARRWAERVESRSLTLAKFDFIGRPHIFYDDHLHLLRRSDAFVARKIWPSAQGLYDHFLGAPPALERSRPNPAQIDRIFAAAVERRTRGRPGLVMQSRFPTWDWENGRTPGPYWVLSGPGDLFADFPRWLAEVAAVQAHGHLYAPGGAEFATGEAVFAGGLPAAPALRDHDPVAFLRNLLWTTRGETQALAFGPQDRQEAAWFWAADPNARVIAVTGAWAVPLWRRDLPFAEARAIAAERQRIEGRYLDLLRAPKAKARVRILSLAAFLERPAEHLADLVAEIGPRRQERLAPAPLLRPLAGFGAFLQALRNQGMDPHLVGDVVDDPAAGSAQPAAKPYLVR